MERTRPPTRTMTGELYTALLHPVRQAILQYLGKHGEANATAIANALGESTGTTSYHLRKLHELQFVEEIAERSQGKQRWWRALPVSLVTPDPASMTPDELRAAEKMARAKTSHDIQLYLRMINEYAGPDGWAQASRHGTFMTKDELHGFYRDLLELYWKYGHTAEDAPEGARHVALRFFAVPTEPAETGREPD